MQHALHIKLQKKLAANELCLLIQLQFTNRIDIKSTNMVRSA